MPIACLSTSSPSTLNRWLPAWHSAPLKGNGVAISRRRYPQQDNGLQCVGKTIKQSIMPTARRDTCSDAKESPFPTFFKGKVCTTISLNTMRMNSCPLGMDRGLAISCFLPPKADFFYGQRPFFEPWRLLSSCKAWRWGWRGQQEGKLVFRLASPTTTKRRSRQQSPWLFVFTSPTNRSS